MTDQSTLLTLLPVRLDTNRPQMSVDACRWTDADADNNFCGRQNIRVCTSL